jgi:hypothetical protein
MPKWSPTGLRGAHLPHALCGVTKGGIKGGIKSSPRRTRVARGVEAKASVKTF